jgi:hypothetical protein
VSVDRGGLSDGALGEVSAAPTSRRGSARIERVAVAHFMANRAGKVPEE